MRTLLTALTAAALTLTSTTTLAHNSAKDNAALDYLREALFLTPELKEVISTGLENVTSGNPDESSPKLTIEQKREIIERRGMIDRIRKAAALPGCDWGVSKEDGPNTLLPHLSPHRHFARLVYLDALIRIDEGDIDGAVENAATIMRMAHHINISSSFLITKLVAVAEFVHAESILESIPSTQLTRTHRAKLQQALAVFPVNEPFQLRQTMMTEVRELAVWLRTNTAGKSSEDLRVFFNENADVFSLDSPRTAEEKTNLTNQTMLQSFIDLYAALEGQIDTRWRSTNPQEELRELDDLLNQGAFGPLARQLAPRVCRLIIHEQKQTALRKRIADLIKE